MNDLPRLLLLHLLPYALIRFDGGKGGLPQQVDVTLLFLYHAQQHNQLQRLVDLLELQTISLQHFLKDGGGIFRLRAQKGGLCALSEVVLRVQCLFDVCLGGRAVLRLALREARAGRLLGQPRSVFILDSNELNRCILLAAF